MENLLSAIRNEGWHIKSSAVESLKGAKANHKEVITKALNCDLCEIGQKYIQETVASSDDGILKGPFVLQINKIRNVSAPKDNEYSSVAPRMLKLSLTDGPNTITAIEYEQVSDISLKTPPGTKIKLVGSVVLSQGCIQLTNSSIKVLGGRVEKLYTKWKIAQDMSAISRMDIQSDNGPPPFVAFGKRTAGSKRYEKSVKSLENQTKDKENENTEFTVQRKAAIANATHKSYDKKETLLDARANFGKIPVGEPKAKVIPSGRINDERNQDHKELVNAESKKSARMYRELSTESGDAVHQKTVNEFVSMGFKYEDVVLCLRRANNDFEEAMDLLTALPEEDSTSHHSHGRNARGRPANRSRGRGRKRGTGKSHLDHAEMEQISGPATLMDFIDNRMSNMLISSKHKQEMSQEDVESTQYDLHKSNWGSGSNRQNYTGNDSDHGNYRGTEIHRGNYRGGGRGYNGGGHRRNNYSRHQEHWNQKNNEYQYSATDNPQQNYSQENFRPPQDRFHHQRAPERRQENRPQQRYSSQSFASSHPSGKELQKQITNEDNISKPRNNNSDFRHKHRENRTARAETSQNPSHEYAKHRVKNDVFSNVPLNPPPQRGPTTFGDPSLGERRPVSPTSYNHPSQISPSFRVPQSLHVTIPQWHIGSHCLAKYWEDSQYYHAMITDIHPEAPTAVVQFVDFGNYEEVRLFDLKPFVTSNEIPIQGIGNQPHLDVCRSHQDKRQQQRHAKPPMALYVHPKHRANQ